MYDVKFNTIWHSILDYFLIGITLITLSQLYQTTLNDCIGFSISVYLVCILYMSTVCSFLQQKKKLKFTNIVNASWVQL